VVAVAIISLGLLYRRSKPEPKKDQTVGNAVGKSLGAEESLRSEYATKCLVEILKLKEGASVDEIKKSYRKEAMEAHPDKGGKMETFVLLNDCYTEWVKRLPGPKEILTLT
jgi:hypothetical protein